MCGAGAKSVSITLNTFWSSSRSSGNTCIHHPVINVLFVVFLLLVPAHECFVGNIASKSRVSVATRPPVIHGLANSSSTQHTCVPHRVEKYLVPIWFLPEGPILHGHGQLICWMGIGYWKWQPANMTHGCSSLLGLAFTSFSWTSG